MDLNTQLHLAAGLAAVALGGATLLRDPRRRRNRLFAALCGALAVWTFGVVAYLYPGDTEYPWQRLYLLGSCAAAPLGLHFCLVIARPGKSLPRLILTIAYVAAAGLYLAAWPLSPGLDTGTKLAAITILGSILTMALVSIAKQAAILPAGPERRAYRLFLAGGLVAVLGGMSDFIPRDTGIFPRIGPLALMVFLLIICSMVVRHRFLDVDRFLARAGVLLTGGAATALFLFGVVHFAGKRYFPLFLASVIILAVAGTIGKTILTGASSLMAPAEPTAAAFMAVSRSLQSASSFREIWEALDKGRKILPAQVRIAVYILTDKPPRLINRYSVGHQEKAIEFEIDSPIARLLRLEKRPVTKRYLQEERLEVEGQDRRLVEETLMTFERTHSQMVVPLIRDGNLLGLILVGGMPDKAVTAEMAAAFLAVGNQALAGMERLEAMAAAEQKKAMAAVGEMAAGLAHEIRNPVAAIHGAVQALGPDTSPEHSTEMLEVIEEESDRLGRVVGEFLDYARPGSPIKEHVDITEIVQKVIRGAELGGFKLNISVSGDKNLPLVLGDPDQIQRAFENLVRNTWEATGDGGVLAISLCTESADNVSITFQDNGPGIPEEEAGRVFQPFHSTKRGGTGLGLALVHRIVESHGGQITLEGRPDHGAAITLSFPIAQET